MVDKLEKTGRKKLHYQLKIMMFILLIAIAITAVMAIPVGISVRLSAAAEEETAVSSLISTILPSLPY